MAEVIDLGPVCVSALTEGSLWPVNHMTAALHNVGMYFENVSGEVEGHGHRSKVSVIRLGNVIFGQHTKW